MRSIEGKLLPIPLTAGINQSGGTRGAPPGSLEYVINGRVRSGGRIERRCGTSAIDGTTQSNAGGRAVSGSTAAPRPTERPAFIASRGSQKLCGTTAGDAFRYSENKWVFQGCFPPVKPVRKRSPLSGQSPSDDFDGKLPAVAALSTGELCVVGATRAGVVHISVESADGVRIYYDTITATDPDAKVIAISGTFYVVYKNSTALTLRRIAVASGQVGTITNAAIATLNNTANHWDISTGASTEWYLAYQSGAATVTVAKITGATVGTTATPALTDPYVSLFYDSVNSLLWLGYLDAPAAAADVGYYAYETTGMTATYGPVTITTTGTGTTTSPPIFGAAYTTVAGSVFFMFSRLVATAGASARVTRYGWVTSGAVGAASDCWNIFPIGKPDAQQRVWCQFAPDDTVSETRTLLLRFADAGIVLTPTCVAVDGQLPGNLSLASYRTDLAYYGYAPNAVAVTTESAGGFAFFAAPVAVQNLTDLTDKDIALVQHQVFQYERWNQSPSIDTAQADDLITAGLPTMLWGNPTNALDATNTSVQATAGACEIGFPFPPAIIHTVVNAGAGALPAGTYLYRAAYQWPDEHGNRHLSAVSPPVTVTVTVPSTVTVHVTDFEVGQRLGLTKPTLLLHRSTDGGTTYHLIPAPPSAYDSADGIVAYTDEMLDAALATNEVIYTDGGVLSNSLAPSCRYVVDAEDRLWCGGLFDRNILQATKVRVPGEPFNFADSPSFQVVLPDECSGLAYMDGQVVAFTPTGIYLVGGDGPNDQGAGAFLPPRALVRGLGCPLTEEASIVETELGIIFRSASSWWLIPRGFGTPQDIGAAVQDESPHCIASAVTETSDYRLVRLLVAAVGSYTSPTVLVMDLTNLQWFRDTYSGAAFGSLGSWPDGAALFENDLSSNAGAIRDVVWSEDEDLDSDEAGAATTYIPLSFRTNWQYPFGPGGWGKVNRVQLAAEPTDSGAPAIVRADSITMTIETDQNSYTPAAWSNTANASSGPLYREVVPTKPQCTCYRVTVQATQTSGTAVPGLRLLSLTAEIGPDGQELGIRPLTSAERS